MDSVLVIRLVLIIADELEDGVFKGPRTASRGTCRGSARMEQGSRANRRPELRKCSDEQTLSDHEMQKRHRQPAGWCLLECRGVALRFFEWESVGVNLEERSVKFGLQVIDLIGVQAH